MALVKVKHDGNEIEVELPEGYQHQDEIRDKWLLKSVVGDQYVLKAEVDRRFQKWVKRDEAKDDPTVIAAVLEAHGKNKPADIDLEKAKSDWSDKELAPVLAFNKSLLGTVRGSAIRDASRSAGFDPLYTDNPTEDVPSYFESAFGDRLEYDPSLKYFVATDKAGNRLAAQEPTTLRPYADASELFVNLAADENWKGYLSREPTNNDSRYKGNDKIARWYQTSWGYDD